MVKRDFHDAQPLHSHSSSNELSSLWTPWSVRIPEELAAAAASIQPSVPRQVQTR